MPMNFSYHHQAKRDLFSSAYLHWKRGGWNTKDNKRTITFTEMDTDFCACSWKTSCCLFGR